MAILAGLYAPDGDTPESLELWAALTRGFGEPGASASEGPLRAAVFPQHAGDLALAPGETAVLREGFPIGFGGDHAGTRPDDLAPPWAICRYDAARRTAVVEADRHGFALVYTRTIGPLVAFCSSAAALGRLPPALELDRSAIAELLAFDHLLGDRTWRRGVTALPQGAALEIGPSGVSLRQRFRYVDVPLERGGRLREVARSLLPLWRGSVEAALHRRGADPVVLVPLSGGLDSRLLAATAVEAGASVDAFTFAREGADAADMAIAREVARALGVPWRSLSLEPDWLAAHARRAAALTDGHLDVVHSYGVSLLDAFPSGRLRLDGLAGDVVLGGSFLKPELLRANTPEGRRDALWRARSRLQHPAWLEVLLPEARGEMLRLARRALADSLEPDPGSPAGSEEDPRWSDFWVLKHRIRRFTVNGPLLWQAVSRSAFAFFAPRWIDRLLAVPPQMRMDSALQASFLWQGFPRMAAIPWQKTGRPVLAGGLWDALSRRFRPPAFRPGAPFFDFDASLRASARLRAFMRDVLLDPRTGIARFGCFDPVAVGRLVRDGEAGERRVMPQLGLLLSLVLGEEVWSPAQ